MSQKIMKNCKVSFISISNVIFFCLFWSNWIRSEWVCSELQDATLVVTYLTMVVVVSKICQIMWPVINSSALIGGKYIFFFSKKNPLHDLLSSLNVLISTNESNQSITGHMIYKLTWLIIKSYRRQPPRPPIFPVEKRHEVVSSNDLMFKDVFYFSG